MKRLLFIAALCTFTGLAFAEPPAPDDPEPPVRLKKKDKPKVEEPEPEKKPVEKPTEKPKKPKDEEPQDAPAPEAKEVVERLNKNLRVAEERLSKKDASERTLTVQRDILKDLDALIDQKQKQQDQQQQQQQNQDQNQQQNKNRNKPQEQNQSGQPDKPAPKPEPEKPEGSEPKPKQGEDKGKESKAGTDSKEGSTKIADLYKDIWGHLPETLRQEMDAYAREQFMAKYQDVLKQYYTTIAEKGRKKE